MPSPQPAPLQEKHICQIHPADQAIRSQAARVAGFLGTGTAAIAQRELQAMIDRSPRMAQQKKIAGMINQSPRVLQQRAQMGILGHTNLPGVVQQQRYVRSDHSTSTREVADDYQLQNDEQFVDTTARAGNPVEKTLVTITFTEPPDSPGNKIFYKATSLGSMLMEGGIAQAGLDPNKGGRGGGSGVWETEATDTRHNLSQTTLASDADATKLYASGFETERKKSASEAAMLMATGMLNAKWIGVTLRISLPDNAEENSALRPDPGSAADSKVMQTSRPITVENISIASISLMLSRAAVDNLNTLLSSEDGFTAEALDHVIEGQYYWPLHWNPVK